MKIPEADVLIHCGDFSNQGKEEEISEFVSFFASQPHKHKLLVSGNHEVNMMPFAQQNNPSKVAVMARKTFPGITYLQDSSVLIEGITFYGFRKSSSKSCL